MTQPHDGAERTANPKLLAWVDEVAALCEPAQIHWCDGSQAEYDGLCEGMVASGAFVRLNPALRPGSFLARSHPSDVARVEDGLNDVRRIARVTGEPGVSIGISKQRGSNEVGVKPAKSFRHPGGRVCCPECGWRNNIRAERKCQKQCFFCQENSKKPLPPPEALVASGDDFRIIYPNYEPLFGLNL